ncbi:MAG: MFS transporter, partial [Dehalococcoidales bacterium]|nr:MFS transporter [Dehalococcoidales bacterium]
MLKKVFPILAFSMFASTLGIGLVAPLLPLYAKNMGATGLWLGLIVASFNISNSIAVPIAGRLSDRRGRKLLLLIGLSIYTISALGYIWANSPAYISLVRFIQGAAGAAIFPISMAYLGDLSPKDQEGKWMGYANAAFFSGFGFGPFLGGVATEHFGTTITFLIMSGLNLLAFLIVLFFLPESSRRKTTEGFSLSFKEMGASGMTKGLFSFRLGQALGSGGIFAFLPIFAALAGLSTSLIGILLTVNYLSPS